MSLDNQKIKSPSLKLKIKVRLFVACLGRIRESLLILRHVKEDENATG